MELNLLLTLDLREQAPLQAALVTHGRPDALVTLALTGACRIEFVARGARNSDKWLGEARTGESDFRVAATLSRKPPPISDFDRRTRDDPAQFDLAYGRILNQVCPPRTSASRRFQTSPCRAPPLSDVQIGEAFDSSPIASPPLDEIAGGDDSVLRVV
jgi:hypothetical protein